MWATAAAAAGIAAAVALGQWQQARALEKLALVAADERRSREPAIHIGEATIAAEQVEHRNVEARGRLDARAMVLLDNRVRNGIAGYEVVMPLDLAGGRMYVLVNRGWIAGHPDRRRLPEIRTPAGEVTVLGRAVIPGKHLYELGSVTVQGPVWQNLTIERYRAHHKLPIQGILIEQNNAIDDGLERSWPTHDRGVNVHRSYAFQWYALAVAIAVAYVVFSFRRVPA